MNRVMISALALCLSVAGTSTAAEANSLVFDQDTRKALHQEIREYLLSNPEILLEMLGIIEERRNLEKEDRDKQLFCRVSGPNHE